MLAIHARVALIAHTSHVLWLTEWVTPSSRKEVGSQRVAGHRVNADPGAWPPRPLAPL